VKSTAICAASAAVELKALSRAGCYCLVIVLANKRTLRIGGQGKVKFSPGTYVYTGSAMNGLKRRLIRHLTGRKKLRWHIDYLLSSPDARVKDILTYRPAPGQECRRNQIVARLPGAQTIVRKFGASDCRAGCAAHLYFFPTTRAARRIATALQRRSTAHLKIR
jgi:Uri superfamily endonuclease